MSGLWGGGGTGEGSFPLSTCQGAAVCLARPDLALRSFPNCSGAGGASAWPVGISVAVPTGRCWNQKMWVINLSGSWEAWLPPDFCPAACKRPHCSVHAFVFTGVFATATHRLVRTKEMTFSPPNLVSYQYCPWCPGFWWTTGAPLSLRWTIYFPLLLMLQWVKVSFWVGAIASSKESWHLFGRRRFSMWGHLPQSLEAKLRDSDPSQETFLASGRGWPARSAPDSRAGSLLGPGTVPHHMSPAEHNFPSERPFRTHNPPLSGSSLKQKSSMFF